MDTVEIIAQLGGIEGLEIVTPAHPNYSERAAISNTTRQSSPPIIAYCSTAAAVSKVLEIANNNNKNGHTCNVRIRSGGHNHEGYCIGDDSIVIDVSRIGGLSIIDRPSESAPQLFWHQLDLKWRNPSPINALGMIGSGKKFGTLYSELIKNNYIVAGGGCQSVSIGGFSQGGGWGPFTRYLGMGMQNIIGVQIVLPNGEEKFVFDECLTEADRLALLDKFNIVVGNNPNLFLGCVEEARLLAGLRGGGGGNFGVVINLFYRIHKVDCPITDFTICYYAPSSKGRASSPDDQEKRKLLAKKIVSKWEKIIAKAPPELNASCRLHIAVLPLTEPTQEPTTTTCARPIEGGPLNLPLVVTISGKFIGISDKLIEVIRPMFFYTPQHGRGRGKCGESEGVLFDFHLTYESLFKGKLLDTNNYLTRLPPRYEGHPTAVFLNNGLPCSQDSSSSGDKSVTQPDGYCLLNKRKTKGDEKPTVTSRFVAQVHGVSKNIPKSPADCTSPQNKHIKPLLQMMECLLLGKSGVGPFPFPCKKKGKKGKSQQLSGDLEEEEAAEKIIPYLKALKDYCEDWFRTKDLYPPKLRMEDPLATLIPLRTPKLKVSTSMTIESSEVATSVMREEEGEAATASAVACLSPPSGGGGGGGGGGDEDDFIKLIPAPSSTCDKPHPHKVTSCFPRIPNSGKPQTQEEGPLLDALIDSTIRDGYDPVEAYKVSRIITLHGLGGNVGGFPTVNTSFNFYGRLFIIQPQAWWDDPHPELAKRQSDWVFETRALLESVTDGAFINFIDVDVAQNINGVLLTYYGEKLLNVLKDLKSKVDPNNILSFPMGIPPRQN